MKSRYYLFLLVLIPIAQGENAEQARIAELYTGYTQKMKGVPDMDAAKARAKLKDLLFIDTRSVKEQKVSMIPGAITLKEFEHAEDARYRGRTLVAYCTIGHRSGNTVHMLRADGHEAFNLRGGILSWCHAGGALLDSKGASTFRVHVWSRKFDLLPSGYDGVH